METIKCKVCGKEVITEGFCGDCKQEIKRFCKIKGKTQEEVLREFSGTIRSIRMNEMLDEDSSYEANEIARLKREFGL